jgi:hypothetical protein
MPQREGARLFREAWISGVREHFPGEPKPGYVTPWAETPDWERQAAGAVYEQVRQFLDISGGHASLISVGGHAQTADGGGQLGGFVLSVSDAPRVLGTFL